MLDESADRAGFEASLRAERVVTNDAVEWSAQDTWLLRPMVGMGAVRRNRYFAAAIDAAPAREWPKIEQTLARVDDPGVISERPGGGSTPSDIPRYSRFFLADDFSFARYFRTRFRVLADRRLTAVSLATQLYRAEHKRWPARLDDLVPTYLPAVPADPFQADGRPLGYVVKQVPPPAAGDRPLIYAEEGPDYPSLITPEPMYGYQQAREPDVRRKGPHRQYRDLARFEPPPSPEAVEGDPEKPDTPGDEGEKDDASQ